MTSPITARLLAAYRTTSPAREALAAVPWPELPGLLRALACEQSPEVAALVARGVGDGSARDLIALRSVLACIGDQARRSSHHGGHHHIGPAAVAEMAAELVGLTGAALALLDAAGAVA